ncbi:hypothetical protein JJE66_33670 [Bradyrhizobium diazoefficiens]|nr:hypothetical protein [Bradyrhizobium diazoefficiens]MBK3666157.1 hypothetical protein [Bradyrhizobium diazoefficiens]
MADEDKEPKEKEVTTEQAGLLDTLTGNSDDTGAKLDDTGRPVKVIKEKE